MKIRVEFEINGRVIADSTEVFALYQGDTTLTINEAIRLVHKCAPAIERAFEEPAPGFEREDLKEWPIG